MKSGYYVIKDDRYGLVEEGDILLAWFGCSVTPCRSHWWVIGRKEPIDGEPKEIMCRLNFDKVSSDSYTDPKIEIECDIEHILKDGESYYKMSYKKE